MSETDTAQGATKQFSTGWLPQMRTILISIRSEFAEAIYMGTKRHEFRRVRVGFASGDRVLIYEPLPTGLVTGEFVVGVVRQGLPLELTSLEADWWSRMAAEQYLQGAHVATAIEVIAATKWEDGIKLNDIVPGIRPPQSYVFIKKPDK